MSLDDIKVAMRENEWAFDESIDEIADALTGPQLHHIEKRVRERTDEGYITYQWERDLEIAMQVKVVTQPEWVAP